MKKMINKQTIISINKNYYDKRNCKFAFCESCYWVATILVDKFNNTHNCYNCRKKDIHVETILI
jgi:CO dehydrogenase/acetyl-CoA synthase gamma subunit (corrinoid Fe-S protein)